MVLEGLGDWSLLRAGSSLRGNVRANDMGLASGKETQAPPNASRSKVQARLVVNFDELPDLIVEGDSHGR